MIRLVFGPPLRNLPTKEIIFDKLCTSFCSELQQIITLKNMTLFYLTRLL